MAPSLMPRIRSIKPEFWTSAQIIECSTNARLLFVGLWNFCDDAGRHPDSPKQLKAEVFPADEFSLDDMSRMIDELSSNDLVQRYVVDGKGYLQVTGWHHQRIDRPNAPRYPGPDQANGEPARRAFDERSRGIGEERIGEDRKGSSGASPPVESAAASSTTNGDARKRADTESVQRIFDHWRETHEHPKAALTEKRRKVIRKALAGYSEALLCQAITGYRNSPHHMGDNDRGTVYDSIELMLRDAEHIDRGLKCYSDPPRTDQSQLTRRNVSQTEGWKPPEMRDDADD